MMIQKYRLNKRRLSLAEVKDLIDTGATLHAEYTKLFLEVYPSGLEVKNLIYQLPDGNFLFVAGSNSPTTPNKGDVYSEDYLLRWLRNKARSKRDTQLKITNSESKWRYYSKVGDRLIEHVEQLVISLSQKLKIEIRRLDKSYKSLSLIDAELTKLDLDYIFENLYDELVAYVGEVIIKRVNGNWDINQNFSGGNYPYISIGLERIQYMPLNVVVSTLNEIDQVNLRLETANEIRSKAGRVSFEKWANEKLDSTS